MATFEGEGSERRMSLELVLTLGDYRSVARWLFLFRHRKWLTITLLFVAIACIGGAGEIFSGSTALGPAIFLLFVAGLSLIGLVRNFYIWTVRGPREAFAQYAQSRPFLLDVSVAGIAARTHTASREASWQQYVGYLEIPGYWIIVVPGLMYFPIPSRDVPDADVPWLEELLARNLRRLKASVPSDWEAQAEVG